MNESAPPSQPGLRASIPPSERLVSARRVLLVFTLTFLTARILVFLIMVGRLPDVFIYIGGTHVHHLSLGIFLMAAAFAYELFWRPDGCARAATEVVYGIALALTFDEFGMWIHLGGSYWQRASFDAIVVVTALLTLLAVAPSLRQFRRGHIVAIAVLMLPLAFFTVLLIESYGRAGERFGPTLRRIEKEGPH